MPRGMLAEPFDRVPLMPFDPLPHIPTVGCARFGLLWWLIALVLIAGLGLSLIALVIVTLWIAWPLLHRATENDPC
jgi:hypothetical protein